MRQLSKRWEIHGNSAIKVCPCVLFVMFAARFNQTDA
jgi:hypothetical protein